MVVYVLGMLSQYEDEFSREVLGVYSEKALSLAYQEMKRKAERIVSIHQKDYLADCTERNNAIQIEFKHRKPYCICPDQVYTLYIEKYTVIE